MAPEIEFTSSNFLPFHKTVTYAGQVKVNLVFLFAGLFRVKKYFSTKHCSPLTSRTFNIVHKVWKLSEYYSEQ